MDISRRKFLKLSSSAGAMLMTIQLPKLAFASDPEGATLVDDNRNIWSIYLHINPDNSILIESPVQDMGQHMKTTGPMMIAEELDADWELVSCSPGKTHIQKNGDDYEFKYADMGTGGSQAVKRNWQFLREAGAVAKHGLMQAAALRWNCDMDELYAQKSYIYRKGTNAKFSYGELAEHAAQMPLPTKELKLKTKAEHHIFGQDITTVDIQELVTGQPLFGMDMEMNNMLHAVIERSPYYQGKVKSFDDSETLNVPGVLKTIPIDLELHHQHKEKVISAGIAVVAKDLWSAMKGRALLKINWDKGPFTNESNETLTQDFKRFCFSDDDGRILIEEGDVEQGFAKADHVIERTFETPHFAHACMEPFNAIVHVQKDKASIITGHQFPVTVATTVAEVLSIDPLNVNVSTTRMGGGFGRRAKNDYVKEATMIAQHFEYPVKLTWTREDEISQDYFGQGIYAKLKVGVDKKGNINSWHHRQGQVSGGMRPGCFPHGLVENFKVHHYSVDSGTPIGAWRGPGHLQHAFVVESTLDEIAHQFKRDPLQYRLDMLGDEKEYEYVGWGADVINTKRMSDCYQQAAELANWNQKRPEGVGLGLAGHFTFGSYAAFVLEIDAREYLKGDGPMKITQCWGSIDCGMPLNPNHIRNQMQGGFIDGLNAALFNQINIEGGQVTNTNFHNLRWLKMAESPTDIQVGIVENDYEPTGVGEPPTAPAAAALTNAIYAATGKRVNKLPISLDA